MIVDTIYAHALRRGDALAIVANGTRLNFNQFANMLERARMALRQQQLPAGTTAIILITNLLHAWIALLSLRAEGLTTICLAAPDKNLKIPDVSVIVTTQSEYNPEWIRQHHIAGAKVVSLQDDVFGLDEAGFESHEPMAPYPTGHICLSTGTTGTPKKILIGEQEDRLIEALIKVGFVQSGMATNGLNRALFTTSIYKSFLAAWSIGTYVIIDQTVEPLSSIKDCPQFTSVPQATLRRYLHEQNPHSFYNENAILRIGGGLFFDEVKKAKQLLSQNIRNSFASSEIGLNPLMNDVETADDVIWLKQTGSNEMDIVDGDGRAVPRGQEGYLRFRLQAWDNQEYYCDAAASAQVFRDGYFYPGDIAIMREDDRVRILGREADIIVVKTDKFMTGPYERSLRDKIGARNVRIIAQRNVIGQDELFIGIEGDCMPTEAAFRSTLPFIPLFEQVHVSLFPEFPTFPNGKLDRLQLRQWLLDRAYKAR